MSWKDEIISKLHNLEKMVQVLSGQIARNSKKTEDLRIMVEQSEKTRSRSADRMADRLIEMALVNQGMGREAAAHRRSLDEGTEKEGDPWQDLLETQWPPSGTDEVHMP